MVILLLPNITRITIGKSNNYKLHEITAVDRTYINYAKLEKLTDRGVVYVTKMKKNLNYEALVVCMLQNPQGLMDYREQLVVSRKDGINHIAPIVTYVNIKKGKKPKLLSLLTNDVDMPLETIVAIYRLLKNMKLTESAWHILKVSPTSTFQEVGPTVLWFSEQ